MEFVSKGILTREEGRLLSRLFDMRQTGDYDDFFEWTEEDVEPLFERTVSLIQRLESLIEIKRSFHDL
ncbi:MAG: HEPN domain-containing protein [Bacteroidales bacterium]|nr:HEPN domain-containing protein [Bacteroidales bacterium]